MKKCSAITQRGTRCEQTIVGPDGLCAAHSTQAAPRAGRSIGGPGLALEAARLRRRLEKIADDVLDAESGVGSKSAAVAVAALNAALRSLSIQARLSEHEELEPMLRALEEEIRWGG